MSWLFTLGGQSIGTSASASVFPMSVQGWFPLGLIGLISLQSKGLSTVFSSITVWKHQSSVLSLLYGPTLYLFIYFNWRLITLRVSVSRSVMPNCLQPHGLQPTRLLCSWDSPGKDTGVGCHLQYCSGFCHTLTWISHGCTCVPHPEPPSSIPPHPIPQGCPKCTGFECPV